MKKITIINLILLLLTQSQSYLLAPAEPAKAEPAKEYSADKQQPTTAAEKNYENQTSPKTPQEPNNNAGAVATKQEPSTSTSKKTEPGISLKSTENTEEEKEEQEEDPTAVLIDHGGESDVDHAQERIREDADKKAEAEKAAQEMTEEQAQKVEAIIEKAATDLEKNSSESSKILEKTAEEMGITSLAPERQNIIMQNLQTEWNQLATKYKDSSIPADELKEFLSKMNSTIKKG